ncbi:NUDIX hydrolase [Paracoccaceae bacterium GXU_MW_L88]
MTPETDKSKIIRDAASLVLIRRDGEPSVLMGKRGRGAAFMPDKFVFPGGAVDPQDADVPGVPLRALPACRLGDLGPALANAAIRELYEEAGLMLGDADPGADAIPAPTEDWAQFFATGHLPDASGLRFIFRAVTPPGRTRRFDARFFMAEADALKGDPDDFSASDDELSDLQWIPLSKIEDYPMPYVTTVVLEEVKALLDDPSPVRPVPYFREEDRMQQFTYIEDLPK